MMRIADTAGKFACLALVGAGGKSSTLFRLARELGEPVFAANSAHLGLEQLALADRCYRIENEADWPDFAGGILPGVTLFCGPELAGRGRVRGLDAAALEHLRGLAGYHAVPLIVEADGSRGLPVKAPAEHEPPIPPFADVVAVCAGMSALGRPLDEAHVFRAEIFSRLSGLEMGQPLDETALARVLRHPLGGLKNMPAGARRVALLNQADDTQAQSRASRLARLLLPDYASVGVVSTRGPGPDGAAQVHAVYRPVAGIVLAAGASSRLGRPKQLLDWRGEPLARRAARAALEGGLDPVVVVTGAEAEAVEAALAGLVVTPARCADWQSGQSASLKAGLRRALELRPDLDGAVFLLCDQPFAGAEVVRAVTDARARTLAPACAPRVAGRRANPVLFGRELFPRLLALSGDAGGRAALDGVRLELVDWADARLGEDIDTAEDYTRLSGLADPV